MTLSQILQQHFRPRLLHSLLPHHPLRLLSEHRHQHLPQAPPRHPQLRPCLPRHAALLRLTRHASGTQAIRDVTVRVYKKWGWSHEHVLLAFKNCPYCMLTEPDEIDAVFSYWVRILGGSSLELVKYPIGKARQHGHALCYVWEKIPGRVSESL